MAEMRAINLDTDWFYRKGLSPVVVGVTNLCTWVARLCDNLFIRVLPVRLGQLSKGPVSALVISYMKMRGKDPLAIEEFRKQTTPEAASFNPMGLPVLISLVFLFALFVIFVFLD